VAPICDSNLVREGKGRFFNRPSQTGGKKYDKFFIYVPTDLAKDSLFPFKDGDSVEFEMVGGALRVKKARAKAA